MAEIEYYSLKKASFFFDGAQSKEENKKLLPGDVKALELTGKVSTALSNGAIQLTAAPKVVKNESKG